MRKSTVCKRAIGAQSPLCLRLSPPPYQHLANLAPNVEALKLAGDTFHLEAGREGWTKGAAGAGVSLRRASKKRLASNKNAQTISAFRGALLVWRLALKRCRAERCCDARLRQSEGAHLTSFGGSRGPKGASRANLERRKLCVCVGGVRNLRVAGRILAGEIPISGRGLARRRYARRRAMPKRGALREGRASLLRRAQQLTRCWPKGGRRARAAPQKRGAHPLAGWRALRRKRGRSVAALFLSLSFAVGSFIKRATGGGTCGLRLFA